MFTRFTFIIALLALVFFHSEATAQKRIVLYDAKVTGGYGKDGVLPFWLYTNTFGQINYDTYLLGNIGVATPFVKTNTRALDYTFGFEGTAALGDLKNRIFIDQLYGALRWQNIVLEIGSQKHKELYNGLSAGNGELLYSSNARPIPGIVISSNDYIKLPKAVGRYLAFKFRYGEYLTFDDRYVNNTRIHNFMVAGRLNITPEFSLEAGFEHYAQWAGDGQPKGFKNYLKIVTVKEGGEDASVSDQINRLGNHLGQHLGKAKYENDVFEASLFYAHQFEDGSGRKFKNLPDGLYGMYFTRKKHSKWFKSALYEIHYTKSQSGAHHNDQQNPDIVLGGEDNYFNHGGYRSGWTYYGNVIGSPFFSPNKANADDLTDGVYNNRFVAHHFGVSGALPLDIEYRIRFSYSQNYGTYSSPFTNKDGKRISKPQFSFGAEFIAPNFNLPFNTALNIGFDKGDLLKNNFGFMLKIFKVGCF